VRFAGRSGQPASSFREALFGGLAPDGGLYFPVETPDLSGLFSSWDAGTSFRELGSAMAARLLGPEVPEPLADRIAREAFTFEPVLRRLDDRLLLLELFHGPTAAFKDFGARFQAAAMEALLEERSAARIQVLVATSGDTGGAVASAFHGRRGIDVVILYPSGRVSDLQERQLTTLGGNVHALEVAGSFDDCQRLAKEAFRDRGLANGLTLVSANSINVGRLLPQSFYYVWAATRRQTAGAPAFCVPSGNFGNLVSGVYAWQWGLPVRRFLAATNVNDVVPQYLAGGRYSPRSSLATLSNAMDVGNPSNFERLARVFDGDRARMSAMVAGHSVTDEDTREEMRSAWDRYRLLVDPHTAVGIRSSRQLLEGDARAGEVIVLATAHPGKFADIVTKATGVTPELPARLARCLELPKRSVKIEPRLEELSGWLRDTLAGGHGGS
jgi:threonine synthase